MGDKELSQVDGQVSPTMPVLERFDLADDDKIIQALSKRVTTGFTYRVNGKYGLSSSGTSWAIREFAKQGEIIRIVGPVLIEKCPFDPDYVNVTLKVQRSYIHPATGKEVKLDSAIGHKRMCRKAKRYLDENDKNNFEMVEDPEFITKAVTKAERNGKLKLIPKDVITLLVAKATGQPMPGSPAKSQPAKGAAKPAGSPPAQGAQPASTPQQPKAEGSAQAPPAQQPAPSASQDAAKPKMSKDVLIQKLDAVAKLLFQTQDGAVARQKLATLTGKASPSELSEEAIKNIGNAINAVVKKTAAIEGNNIIKLADKSILWKGPELPKQEAAAQEEAPSEDIMF